MTKVCVLQCVCSSVCAPVCVLQCRRRRRYMPFAVVSTVVRSVTMPRHVCLSRQASCQTSSKPSLCKLLSTALFQVVWGPPMCSSVCVPVVSTVQYCQGKIGNSTYIAWPAGARGIDLRRQVQPGSQAGGVTGKAGGWLIVTKGRPLMRWDPCQQSLSTARTRPSAVTLCPANNAPTHAASHVSLKEPLVELHPVDMYTLKAGLHWRCHVSALFCNQ
jgi:hypothetical protein